MWLWLLNVTRFVSDLSSMSTASKLNNEQKHLYIFTHSSPPPIFAWVCSLVKNTSGWRVRQESRCQCCLPVAVDIHVVSRAGWFVQTPSQVVQVMATRRILPLTPHERNRGISVLCIAPCVFVFYEVRFVWKPIFTRRRIPNMSRYWVTLYSHKVTIGTQAAHISGTHQRHLTISVHWYDTRSNHWYKDAECDM